MGRPETREPFPKTSAWSLVHLQIQDPRLWARIHDDDDYYSDDDSGLGYFLLRALFVAAAAKPALGQATVSYTGLGFRV